MRRSLIAAATMILAGACACASSASVGAGSERVVIQPSGVSGQRSFAATGFDRIDQSVPFNVVVAVGGAHAVRAEGDTGLMQHLDVRVESGRLRIGLKEGRFYSYSGAPGSLTIHVSMPALTSADLAGSGHMQVSPFRAANFSASVAGSGNLVLDHLYADKASFDVAGSGDVHGAGEAREARLEIAGSGNVRLAGLKAERAHVSVVGSGNAELRATSEATVEIVGSGDVAVAGGARCSVTRLGSGTVHCP